MGPAPISSRRSLLAGGAALAALGLHRYASAQTLTPSILPARPYLTTEVRINGRGPFRFVVDTGADRTILATDVAQALALPPAGPVLVAGVVRSVVSDSVEVRQIDAGRAGRENIRLPLLPRAALQADGYLGLDVFDGSRVIFDFRNRTLDIIAQRPNFGFVAVEPRESVIPVQGSNGHLRAVNCRVDGVRAVAFIDTGAEVTAGNPALLAALRSEHPGYPVVGNVALSGVTGGTVQGGITGVSEVWLRDIGFSSSHIVIADLQVFGMWGLAMRPALMIGLDVLTKFARVSIDYGRKEFRLKMAAGLRLARRL